MKIAHALLNEAHTSAMRTSEVLNTLLNMPLIRDSGGVEVNELTGLLHDANNLVRRIDAMHHDYATAEIESADRARGG